MKADNRLYELDLLRFLAALAVMVYHYGFRGYSADGLMDVSYQIFSGFARYGFFGFHLFFIVSGFVILLSVQGKDSIGFVISRIVRLYPAYWLCVSITFLFCLFLGDNRYQIGFGQYLVNLSMIQEYLGVKSVDGVYWTLMVELKFYFLIFLVLLFRQIKRIKYILGAWFLLSLVFNFYTIKYVEILVFPEWSFYFIAGACFYLVHKEGADIYYVSLILATYLQAIYKALGNMGSFVQHYNAELSPIVIVAVISFFYGVFFMVATHKASILKNKKFLLLGTLTYPLYLLHQNIGYMIINALHTSMNKYVLLFLIMINMLLASHLVHIGVEKRYALPFKKLLASLAGRSEPIKM